MLASSRQRYSKIVNYDKFQYIILYSMVDKTVHKNVPILFTKFFTQCWVPWTLNALLFRRTFTVHVSRAANFEFFNTKEICLYVSNTHIMLTSPYNVDPPYTPLLYSEIGVYRGIYIFFLFLLLNIDIG